VGHTSFSARQAVLRFRFSKNQLNATETHPLPRGGTDLTPGRLNGLMKLGLRSPAAVEPT
jgi:hypothetical protein